MQWYSQRGVGGQRVENIVGKNAKAFLTIISLYV